MTRNRGEQEMLLPAEGPPYTASMRVNPGMHVEWVDDEAVVLDPESGQLHYLNGTAAIVFALILEHGFDKAIDEVRGMFPGDQAVEADLPRLIEEMTESGLLTDE